MSLLSKLSTLLTICFLAGPALGAQAALPATELEQLKAYKAEVSAYHKKRGDRVEIRVGDLKGFMDEQSNTLVPSPLHSELGQKLFPSKAEVDSLRKKAKTINNETLYSIDAIYFSQEFVKNNAPFEDRPNVTILENLREMSLKVKTIDTSERFDLLLSIPAVEIIALKNSETNAIRFWSLDNRRIAQLLYIYDYWDFPSSRRLIHVRMLSPEDVVKKPIEKKFNTKNNGRCVTFEGWDQIQNQDYLKDDFYSPLVRNRGSVCKRLDRNEGQAVSPGARKGA